MTTTPPKNAKKRKIDARVSRIRNKKRKLFEETNIDSLPPELLALIALSYGNYEIYGRVASTCKAARAQFSHCQYVRRLFDRVDTHEWREELLLINKVITITIYRRAYKTHREGDLPAWISPYEQKWYREGRLCRDNDQPAVVESDGTERWYDAEGKQHRDNDKPAVQNSDGTQIWYEHGLVHRKNGPAVQHGRNLNMWYFHGVYQG